MKMKILLVGNGGREHALAWKVMQDAPHAEVIAAPGNPGIAAVARCVPVNADDVDGLLALARGEQPAITIVGPEAPLAAGLVDRFRAERFATFGPTRDAAQIETSKRFAKELMRRAQVPTALATHHTTVESAKRAVAERGAPVVIKASGLAAGKGVIVAHSADDAYHAIDSILRDHAFGSAGDEILVEEFMEGEELSIFALCDGERALLMTGAQDHKRLLDGDRGPNTGGMGAYTPVSIDTPAIRNVVHDRIIVPALAALRDAGTPFTGLLYAGLMLTSEGPKVVEFNCRFGDPETQALLPLMRGPLLDAIEIVARGDSLANADPFVWQHGACVATVVATPGYPDHAQTGAQVLFPPAEDDVYVFHAGTRVTTDHPIATAVAAGAAGPVPGVTTAGGRVLAVAAIAATLEDAAARSREYAEGVVFPGKQLRRDIGWREIERRA